MKHSSVRNFWGKARVKMVKTFTKIFKLEYSFGVIRTLDGSSLHSIFFFKKPISLGRIKMKLIKKTTALYSKKL